MDNKRFQDIYGAVQSEVRDTSSSFQTIAKRYVNDGYDEILRRLIESNIVEQFRTFPLTTQAGVRSYAAPYDFGEIVYATDTTNGRALTVASENDVQDKYYTAINTTGTPFYIIPRADSNFRSQPASSTTIKIVSDSASDTSQSVFIRGISGSAEYYESISYNGTSTAASSNSYDYLIEAVKSATTTGKTTITYSIDSSVAAVVSPESYFERYKVLEFYYVPAGAYSFNIRYRRQIKPMSQDNDIPIVDGIAKGIEFYAIARAWKYKRQFGTANQWMNDFETWYTEYVTQRSKNGVQTFDVMAYPREF